MSALTDLLFSGASQQELIDSAEDYIGNPIAFIDVNQNESLFSKSYPSGDIEDKLYRRKNISTEEYRRDTEYVTSLARTGTVHIIAWPNIRRRRIICGSVIGDNFLGGIRLPDVDIPFETLSSEKIEESAKVLGLSALLNGCALSGVVDDAHSLLWNILNGKTNPKMLASRMVYPLFPENTTFGLLWFRGKKLPVEITSSVFAYTTFEGGYVCLADYEKLSIQRGELDIKLSGENFTGLICVSDCFSSLSDIIEQLLRAQKCEHYALRRGKTNGLVFFSDYRLEFIVEKMSADSEMSSFLTFPLKKLIEYDKEKGTDFLETIKAYLDSNHDINAAAEKLCIHKNTLFYRLNRINTLFEIDLNNSKTLAEIYCGLMLVEMQL